MHSQGGSNEMVARLDWLTFTTRRPVDDVLEAVEAALGEPVAVRGLYGYEQGYLLPAGARIDYSGARDEVCVTLPGQACGVLGVGGVVKLAAGLGGRPSRLDLAVDGCPFTPADIRREWLAGRISSRVRRDGWQWYESSTGETFYLGSPSSDRRARCYTMADRVDAAGVLVTRWETQYRRDRARAVWAHIQAYADLELGQLALGLIADHVRVTEVGAAQVNVSERPTAAWWVAFVNGAEAVKTWLGERVSTTYERLERYVMTQVSGSLSTLLDAAVLRGGDGYSLLHDILTVGAGRRRRHHQVILAGVAAGV